jgi:hypothetical protein
MDVRPMEVHAHHEREPPAASKRSSATRTTSCSSVSLLWPTSPFLAAMTVGRCPHDDPSCASSLPGAHIRECQDHPYALLSPLLTLICPHGSYVLVSLSSMLPSSPSSPRVCRPFLACCSHPVFYRLPAPTRLPSTATRCSLRATTPQAPSLASSLRRPLAAGRGPPCQANTPILTVRP